MPSRSKTPLPSMAALRVLLAVAERGSTTAAAEAANLSQSAVSKQILRLEELTGQPLFLRTTAGMVPTEAGRIYLQHARTAIKAMEDAALQVARLVPDPKVLRLQVLPILGDRWLVPRFARFSEAHADIDVQFTTFISATQVEAPDGVFRFCRGLAANEDGFPLFGRDVLLVAAPAYWERSGMPHGPADLCEGVMLEHPQTPLRWAQFAEAHALSDVAPKHTVHYGFYTMVIRAALAGQGMAFIPRGLIAEDLQAGRLVNPAGLGYRGDFGYWFAMAKDRPHNPALDTFATWLAGEIA